MSTSALRSAGAFVQPVSSHPSALLLGHTGVLGLLQNLIVRRTTALPGTWSMLPFAVNPAAQEGAVLLNPFGKGGGS